MHILDFLEELPESNDTDLVRYLHNFISLYPEVTSKVMFNTPFYTRRKWLIYLSRMKKGGYEVCFVHANRFTKHIELLDFKKRKQVAGITYQNVSDINEEVLDMLISEAVGVDNTFKKK